jgi:hypothetical protein
MTDSGKSQRAKMTRWGAAAFPLGVFLGVVLGAVIGATMGNIGIGVMIGAGLGIGFGVFGTVAAFIFRPPEPPDSR